MPLLVDLLRRYFTSKKFLSRSPEVNQFMLNTAVDDILNFLMVGKGLRKDNLSRWTLLRYLEKKFFVPEKLPQFKEEVAAWSQLWFRKWLERVKISFGPPPQNLFTVENTPTTLDKFTIEEITEKLVPITIRYGELCATELLPTLAIKLQLRETVSSANLLSAATKQLRTLLDTHGPLVFFHVENESVFSGGNFK